MKRVMGVVLAGWFLLVPGYWIPAAWADDPVVEPAVESAVPAVLNHPMTAWKITKAAVDYLQPGLDWNYLFNGGGAVHRGGGAGPGL